MRRGLQALLAVSGLWMASPPARADDTGDLESLLNEQVVVTAASAAQRESSAPAFSTTVTGEDLRKFGFRSIAQAIDFLSLGVFTGDPLRTPDIGSRGILFGSDNGKHFLLLINGHAVNDPLYGAARFDAGMGIPIELVDHIELMLGPGSVLYGSNAMMGVINVITKNAADYRGVHAYAETEIGRSLRAGAGAGHTFVLFGLSSELTLGVEYLEQYGPSLNFQVLNYPPIPVPGGEPIPPSWGGPLHNGYFTRAPSGHFRLRVGDLEVNLFAHTYKRGIPYASKSYYLDFDDEDSWELDRGVRFDIRHNATISAMVQLTTRLYVDGFDYQRRLRGRADLTCQYHAEGDCQRYDAGYVRWIGLDESLKLNWLRDQTLVTMIGVDARAQDVGAKQDQIDPATGQAVTPTVGLLDDEGASIAPYIQQTWNPASWIDLNAGARLDIDDRFSAVLSPRGAVVLRPLERTTLKAIYSQAFRAPTWSETSLANHTVVPAPDLLPERVRSVEVSAEQGFGTQRLRLGAFFTRWTDLVETAPVSLEDLEKLQASGVLKSVVLNAVQSHNVASIRNYGFTGSWHGSSLSGQLRYGANVTWAFARIATEETSTRIPAAPSIYGNAHVLYHLGQNWPDIALAVQAMSERPADAAAPDGHTLPPAPAFAGFHLALTGRVPNLAMLGYVLSADYLTAKHGPYTAGPDYSTLPTAMGMLSTLPAPGFAPVDELRIMVGLRVDFLTGDPVASEEAP